MTLIQAPRQSAASPGNPAAGGITGRLKCHGVDLIRRCGTMQALNQLRCLPEEARP
jgi:hypothetical protein